MGGRRCCCGRMFVVAWMKRIWSSDSEHPPTSMRSRLRSRYDRVRQAFVAVAFDGIVADADVDADAVEVDDDAVEVVFEDASTRQHWHNGGGNL